MLSRPSRAPSSAGWFPLLWLGAACLVWRWAYRYWFPAGDDYLHTALAPGPGITFSAGQWWDALCNDWMHRNGRLADAWLRLALRPGFGTFQWIAPGVLVLGACAVARILGREEGQWQRARRLVLATFFVPAALWSWPEQTGDVMFWAAGAFNYLVPLVALLFAVPTLSRIAQGRDLARREQVLSCFALVFAQTAHEQAALAGLGMLCAVLVARRGAVVGGGRVVLSVGIGGSLAQLAAPGLRARLGQTPAHAPTVCEHLDTSLQGIAPLVAHAVPGFLIGAAALLGLWWWPRGRAGVILPFTSLVLVLLAWLVPDADNALPGACTGQSARAWLLLVVIVAAALAGAACLLAARELLGPVPALCWSAAWSATLPNLATGTAGARAQFIAFLLLALALLVTLEQASRHLRGMPGRAGRAALTISLCFLAVSWWSGAMPQLQDNSRFFHTMIEAPLREAAHDHRRLVLLPRQLPHPSMSYAGAFLLPRYAVPLANYYGLASFTTVHTAPR